MMISSNVDQPTFCATLNAVGSHEPRCPSGARSTTIPGTRASAPIAAAIPSRTLPATAPTRIASIAVGSDSAGTSSAPITITSSETDRFPQSSSESSVPRTRSRSGTGLIPQLGVRSSIGGECTTGVWEDRRHALSPCRIRLSSSLSLVPVAVAARRRTDHERTAPAWRRSRRLRSLPPPSRQPTPRARCT